MGDHVFGIIELPAFLINKYFLKILIIFGKFVHKCRV